MIIPYVVIFFAFIFCLVNNFSFDVEWANDNLEVLERSIASYTRSFGNLPPKELEEVSYEKIGISKSFFDESIKYEPIMNKKKMTPFDNLALYLYNVVPFEEPNIDHICKIPNQVAFELIAKEGKRVVYIEELSIYANFPCAKLKSKLHQYFVPTRYINYPIFDF
jgi:hypothetical protein